MSTPRVRIAGGLAVFAVVASIGGTMLAQREEPASVSGRFTHPRFGWTIDVPSGFRAFSIQVEPIHQATGVLVANFEVEDPSSLAEFRSFPARGAALRVWSNDGGPVAPIADDDADLPIDFSSLGPIDRYVGGSEPRPLFWSFNANGTAYAVAAWFGPASSEADRGALDAALASLAFPPTSPDTIVHRRLIVLGPADAYRVGSVTRFDRGDLPLQDGVFAEYEGEFNFYLVRGPSGFYAVTIDFLGNGANCDLELEEDPLAFACPAEGWRWDRFGRLVEKGPPWPDGTSDLLILPTPRSWDGNLMLDPFGNCRETAIAAWEH